MSEWLSFNDTWAIFQLYHFENKLDLMMISSMYLTNILSWIFIVLAQWKNSLWVDMLLHSDTYPDEITVCG